MTTDFVSTEEIKKATGWVIFLSIVLIVLGILAVLSPVVASAFFTAMMGWIALIGGIIQIVQSFRSHPVRGFWLTLIVGIFYAIAGLYILFNIPQAMVALTLAFGILFIVEGIFTIIMGFTNRSGRSMSWLVVLNGIITLILGIMVLNRWPFSALWLIGLYVGISLLFSGISLLAAALAARKEVEPA
ncbi:MAG TPA: HdeD family acid-resistance protein [Leptolyngbyaceae cyanobacterium M65_K2018_010]|nr:HdeD family acid-resistance protein [Leptolyngbyaceae cyanobacterium M65_K2018_010]